MTRTITIILLFQFGLAYGQVEQYELKSDLEFNYFDFIPLKCPCTTENMTEEVLHYNQLQEYKFAQIKADSLTKIDSPCYEYRARFICGAHYFTESPKPTDINLLDYDPTIVDRMVLFQKPINRDSTICPTWQIEIVKIRSIELMRQDHSGSTICDDEIK